MMDTIFFILGAIFVSALLSAVFYITLNLFNVENIEDKKFIPLLILLLTILLLFSCYRDSKREAYLKRTVEKAINQTSTRNELVDKLYEDFINYED